MNKFAAWLALYAMVSAGGIASISYARGFDESSAAVSVDHLPAQPSTAIRALIGEYGVGDNLLSIYEAGGRLHADGRDLHQALLQPDGPLRYTTEAAGAREKTRFAFHLDAEGHCDAISINGEGWPRRDAGAEAIAAIRSGLKADPVALRAAALSASPPVEPSPKHPMDLAALSTIDSSIQFDIRYASTNNFMGFPLYDQPGAFLQRPAADALGRIAKSLRSKGYGLLIYDAY